jgi:hypothetical protein
MESLLWALDLGAVVYLCLWALKREKANEKAAKEKAAQERKHA